MDLDRFVSASQRDLAAAVPEDSAAAEHAERLALALDSSLRLTLINALAAAADELSADLAPGSVSLALSGGEPRLTASGLTPTADTEAEAEPAPQPTPHSGEAAAGLYPAASGTADALEADHGETARINLRLPESLKSQAEAAAAAAGQSVNAWLVRTVASAVTTPPLPPTPPAPPRAPGVRNDGRRITGWMN